MQKIKNFTITIVIIIILIDTIHTKTYEVHTYVILYAIDELILMDVQAHSGQQQQFFWLSVLEGNVNGLFCPITIQFHQLASQTDRQTAMKALLFCQIFFVNFLR